MNSRESVFFDRRVIVTLLMTAIAVFCLAPPARTQGTVVIPGVVINGLTIHPGDIISLGYEVAITDTNPVPITIAVTNPTMQLSVTCPNGSSETITVNAPAQSFLIPANINTWFPSDTTYEGATTAPPTLCGGQGGVETAVTFTSTSTMTCNANSAQGCCHTMCGRMHHKDHESATGAEHESGFAQSCKPVKQCTSAQTGGCCKQ